jgi:hypothetical protein
VVTSVSETLSFSRVEVSKSSTSRRMRRNTAPTTMALAEAAKAKATGWNGSRCSSKLLSLRRLSHRLSLSESLSLSQPRHALALAWASGPVCPPDPPESISPPSHSPFSDPLHLDLVPSTQRNPQPSHPRREKGQDIPPPHAQPEQHRVASPRALSAEKGSDAQGLHCKAKEAKLCSAKGLFSLFTPCFLLRKALPFVSKKSLS